MVTKTRYINRDNGVTTEVFEATTNVNVLDLVEVAARRLGISTNSHLVRAMLLKGMPFSATMLALEALLETCRVCLDAPAECNCWRDE